MKKTRDNILKGLLRDIADISDKEYQQRIWIRAEGPECDDFIEIVCRFFLKAEAFLEELHEYKLSNSQVNTLKIFIHEFEKFSDDNDLPQLFIDTPEWTKITLIAKEVLQSFDYQKVDINKEKIFEGFLHDIADISDTEYRERIWILAEGSESDDFTKIVHRYLNTAKSILENHKDYGISEIQLHLLKKFHEEFKKFWTENDLPKLLIDTPEWTKITMMAKEVLQAFDYQK